MNKKLSLAASLLLAVVNLSAAVSLTPTSVLALSVYRTIPMAIRSVAFTATQRTPSDELIGENRPNWLSVEYQRGVMQPMTFGVTIDNPAQVSNEWLAIYKAFSYQRSDGGFIYAPIIAGVTQPPTQEPSNNAFFLAETVTPFLLLLQDKNIGPSFQPQLQSMVPGLILALQFLEKPSSLRAMESNDTKACNRIAIDAKALLLNGLLLQDEDAVDAGQLLLAQVIGAQQADGVFPEDGGSDSSYQAVTLLKLCEIYVFDEDPAIQSALAQGFAWELSRVLPSGEIDTSGNSRVGPHGETYFGTRKTVNYPEVIRAFALYGAITRLSPFTEASVRICEYYSALQK